MQAGGPRTTGRTFLSVQQQLRHRGVAVCCCAGQSRLPGSVDLAWIGAGRQQRPHHRLEAFFAAQISAVQPLRHA
jgi:hypothetical protein